MFVPAGQLGWKARHPVDMPLSEVPYRPGVKGSDKVHGTSLYRPGEKGPTKDEPNPIDPGLKDPTAMRSCYSYRPGMKGLTSDGHA